MKGLWNATKTFLGTEGFTPTFHANHMLFRVWGVGWRVEGVRCRVRFRVYGPVVVLGRVSLL